jgi:hypothetical protein
MTQYSGVLSKCHAVSQYTPKCNFTYSHKKSTAFAAPIIMKHILLCADLLYRIKSKSDKCGKQVQKSMYTNKLSLAYTAPIYTKLVITQ